MSQDKKSYGKGRSTMARSEKNGTITNLGRLQEALEGVDLADVGQVKQVWVKTGKDEDGEDTLSGLSILLTPSWEDGPEWPVVQPAKPITVKIPKTKPTKGAWKTCLVLPDTQIGFRRKNDGTLDPFHDVRALDLAVQVAEELRPDKIIQIGDFLDFAEFGRFRQEPGFAQTAQAAIDAGYEFLAKLRPFCNELVVLEGNHDLRIQTSIMENAVAAFGLRKGMMPESWPALSVPNLLRFEELDIEYIDGYPTGAHYINDNLVTIHGRRVNSNGCTMLRVLDDEQVSVIAGHIHRTETVYKTRNTRKGPKVVVGHSPGTLARTDGAVPSAKSALDSSGGPTTYWEDWQQGLTIVHYEDTGKHRFELEHIRISQGNAWYRGQMYSHNL